MTNKSGARVEKDVGVWITSDLKPSVHCQKASKKAMQSLGMVKRSFKPMNRQSFAPLYRAYMRQHLELCVQAMTPYLAKDIDSLEHRATKLVLNIAKLAYGYDDRLKHLRLYPLSADVSYET